MIKTFNYRIALALAAALAATGCVHRPYGVTPIPHQPTEVADQNPYGTVQQEPPPQVTPVAPPAERPVVEKEYNPADWVADPHALAAYTVHFSFDSAVIRDSQKANLQQVAATLNQDPSANLRIEGNCDERGTEEYNRSLGERRAEAAREALVGLGVDPNRIHTISYGKDQPADHGHSEAAWSQNRRDDFVLLHPKAGA